MDCQLKFRVKSITLITLITFYTHLCAQDIEEPGNLKEKSYFEMGITLGTPALFNAVVGYSPGPLTFHLSGMYQGSDTYGMQLQGGYIIKDNTKVRHTLGIAVAHSRDPYTNFYHAGPVYQLNYRKLFLEAGFGRIVHLNQGEFRLPYWIFFQVGYVYRFLPK